MAYQPILGFDTSALNALADDSESSAVVAGLVSAFAIRLNATNVEEIGGTPDAFRRDALLDVCQRLLTAAEADCVWPFQYITEQLIKRFELDRKAGRNFDWASVPFRALPYEQEIIRREILNDTMAAEHQSLARDLQHQFASTFNVARPAFEKLFASGTDRPTSFQDFVSHLQGTNGAFWSTYGMGFYERVAGYTPDEATVRKFASECPPYYAVLLASTMAQYERCIRDLKSPVSYRAGRTDLFMAVYLPYCEHFVTNDDRQERCLQEIAAAAGISTTVLSYQNLRKNLLVA